MSITPELNDGYSLSWATREEQWTECLSHFQDASFYQSWAYGSVHWKGDQIDRLLLSWQNKVVAAVQIRNMRIPVLGGGIAYIFWGPLWRHEDCTDNPDHLRAVLYALKKEYAINRRMQIRIRPNIYSDTSPEVVKTYIEEGFDTRREDRQYRTLLLDLSPDLQTIRNNFKKKWRYYLNRAEKLDIEIREGNNDQLFEVFLQIAEEMLSRKGFQPGVDYQEFYRIHKSLPENEKFRILVCYQNGIPGAALVCSAMGDTGIYLLGATNDEGNEYNGSYLLQWKTIEWLKENGIQWYDLGGINPDSNPGVYHFKSGCAGKTGQDLTHIGPYYYCSSSLNKWLIQVIERIKKR